MLKVTLDRRKLALDQRIMNPLLADDLGSKMNACVDNVFKIWQGKKQRWKRAFKIKAFRNSVKAEPHS